MIGKKKFIKDTTICTKRTKQSKGKKGGKIQNS